MRASPIHDQDNLVTKKIIQVNLPPSSFFNEDYVVANTIDLVHFSEYKPYDRIKAKKMGPILGQFNINREEAQINHYWCHQEKYYLEEKIAGKTRLQNEDFGTSSPWLDENIRKYLNLYNYRKDV